MSGWIGVDFDGTLAQYENFIGPSHCGAPIPVMVARVKCWLEAGHEVRVFTARVHHDGSPERIKDAEAARIAIEDWCEKHIGKRLKVTNVKDYSMWELWDDRAVQVIPNTGEPVGKSTRGLE